MKQTISKFILLLSCLALVSSCDANGDPSIAEAKKLDPIDRDSNLTRDDFEKMRDINSFNKPDNTKKTKDGKNASEPPIPEPAKITANLSNVIEPPIPDLAEILAAPPKPKIGQTQLVSLAVTDDVPLKDVLLEVARLAKVDIDVDASISGGISMRANNKPFNEVIERIADMAGLRYTMKNGVLRVERDTPYIQVYTLDMLNVDRSSQNSINSTNSSGGGGGAAGGAAGGAGGGGSSGSSSSITYKTDSDFWAKFEGSVAQILAYSPSARSSATTTATQAAPPALPAAPALPAPSDNKSAAATPAPATAPAPATPAPVSAPVAAPAPTPVTAGNNSFYILNRQAGTITVSATQKQHETLKRFIDKVSENASAQVLIEAKIVEVDLNDNYQTGVNWQKLGGAGGGPISFAGNMNNVLVPPSNNAGAAMTAPTLGIVKNSILGLSLNTAVSMLDEFGTTRALSSPRLNAVNNQQAVLSFAQNYIYFKVNITSTAPIPATATSAGTASTITVTSTQLSTPVGLTLSLQPSINTDSNEVTMSIRPTITRWIKDVTDPGFEVSKAVAIGNVTGNQSVIDTLNNTHSTIPQVETRELDSIVKIKSGQTLVIGGLLQDNTTNNDTGVPYAGSIPVIGNLFKSVTKTNNKSELVIFIRATIVGSNGSADPYDKKLYEKFIQDPHPIKF